MNENSQNPKKKPQGQLAAMLQSRGWDETALKGEEINRSSSAPPTQLRNENFEEASGYESSGTPGQKPQIPANNNWNLWGPPANAKGKTAREPQLFAPNPVAGLGQ